MNIESRPQSGVAVVGLGYVGLPLCLAFAEAGVRTIGIDTDSSKATALNDGQSYIKHVSADRVKEAIHSARLVATTDFGDAAYADAVLICVPTPLTVNRVPDLSYVEATARSLAPHVRRGQLVVLESTTYPGTTDEVLRPILEAGSGLVAGVDFHLAFSPEREDPGNPKSLRDIPKVVGGLTVTCRERATALYSQIVGSVVPVSSPSVAEATKLLENIFRAVNIALVNELKVIYDRMGIDVWEVIHAAATKPFGYMPFYPGPGLGGHCIPIDPVYLATWARDAGEVSILDAAIRVNRATPEVVANKLLDEVFQRGLTPSSSSLLIVGRSYKPNSDDLRESPYFPFMHSIKDKFASVTSFDPLAKGLDPGADLSSWEQLDGREFDVVVCLQQHNEVVLQNARLRSNNKFTSSHGSLNELGWSYIFSGHGLSR
jgi:UDP-N-acetyl-D-glucosamine dehydrogenase